MFYETCREHSEGKQKKAAAESTQREEMFNSMRALTLDLQENVAAENFAINSTVQDLSAMLGPSHRRLDDTF